VIQFTYTLENIILFFYGFNTVTGMRFFISVQTGDNPMVFHIGLNEKNEWEIMGAAPIWAVERQHQLFRIIDEHFNRKTGQMNRK